MCDIKNPLDKIYGKLDVAEKKINELKNIAIETLWNENMDRKTNFNR